MSTAGTTRGLPRWLALGLWVAALSLVGGASAPGLLAGPIAAQIPGQAPGTEPLYRFLADVQSLRAEFEQTLLDDRGEVLERATGTFALARPGRFRWDYRAPFEQLVVADGTRLWVYDIELEQITVTAQDGALSQTPAMLLSGSARVEERFVVTGLGREDGLDWVELTPRQPESNFERVRLGFRGEDLERMEMVDAFGQITAFRFRSIQSNGVVEDALFEFVPPAGVDVVGEGRGEQPASGQQSE